jgi:hypothetical protein
MYMCIILKLDENKRPLATGPPTPRLYGKFKFWNYCKLEVRKIVIIKFDIEFHMIYFIPNLASIGLFVHK